MGLFSIKLFGTKKRTLELPSQSVLRQACLRSAGQVELVVVTDVWGGQCDVRLSRLHDRDDQDRLLLAKTLPRPGKPMVGQTLEVTLSHRAARPLPGGRRLRVGYKTPLKAVWDNYQMRHGLRDDVLAVDGPQTLASFTMRCHYRLNSDQLDGVEVYLMPMRTQVHMLDFSVGGMRFKPPPGCPAKRGQRPGPLLLVRGRVGSGLEGKVVRNGTLGGRDDSLPFTVVKFGRLASLVSDLQRGN